MIVLGTRGSPLAVAQANLVVRELRRLAPEVEVRLRVIESEGDRRPTAPLSDPGVDGWFTSRLQEELGRGEVDAAVHSAKDLPTDAPAGLAVVAYLERADPRDVMVTQGRRPWRELALGARVGTSSPRRAAQLTDLRPDLQPLPVRGNVQTRLRKVDSGEVDAVVLASAGLQRLGLDIGAEALDPRSECTPAPAQGAIAVEATAGSPSGQLLEQLDHPPTRAAVEAERRLLKVMGGGCRLALGALAEPWGEEGWRLTAAYSSGEVRSELRRSTLETASEGGLALLVRELAAELALPR
ncbi:MAG: hydroxymethylbilane synthase [Candidatus Dormiibacterota bacterium]